MTTQCQNCGLPISIWGSGHVGPVCKCSGYYGRTWALPAAPPNTWTEVVKPLTEADIRRIVREEIQASQQAQGEAKCSD